MSRSMRVVIAVVALAAVVLAIASVATSKTSGFAKSSSGCATGRIKIVDKHEGDMKAFEKCEKAIVELYEKYEKEFVAIHERHEGKIVEITEKIEALGHEIDESAKADEPDLGKLQSRLKKMSDLRFELTKLKFRMHKEAGRVVDEGDRAALDRHFAMMVGCCGGTGMQAMYHPDRATGKFGLRACCPGGMPSHCAGKADVKACCPGGMPRHCVGKGDMRACCPGGMPSHCVGKGDMKACCPGGMPSHCAGKADMKACCPGSKGHTSVTSPRVLFVGEKDGHAEVQVLDDVYGMLGCTPGVLGEKHIELPLDDEDDALRHIEVLLDDEHDAMPRIEVMLDDEDLEADAHRIIKRIRAIPGHEVEDLDGDRRRIIKRIRAVPGDETDDLIWTGRGGSVGPF